MCIMEYLEVLEHQNIEKQKPEYWIMFWNNLLAVKWADRSEFEHTD